MKRELDLQGLANLLYEVSGLDVEELSRVMGISKVAINDWRRGKTQKLKPKTIHKLGDALKKNNWGISLGNIRGSKIEIIQNTKDGNNDAGEKDIVIYKLIKENFRLKEDLEKIKSKKKH